MTQEKFVTYEAFGAVGDGKTDDMQAIAKAHAYANEHHLPVRANDGATYYVGGTATVAEVRTDVEFGTAHFVIDDVRLEDLRLPIFAVKSAYKYYEIDVKTLSKDQKKLDFPHEGKALVYVSDENTKLFIRYGGNANPGTAKRDSFVVDEEGNICSPIDWNYSEVTKAVAVRIDEEPLTIHGGIFTTVANQAESLYNYHARGFIITRSNVTVEGLTHYITGELDHGAPYRGFLTIESAVGVTLKNCLMTAHFIYRTMGKGGSIVPMGSYDVHANSSIDVCFENITQTTDIMDRRYWGLMASNFCKNITLKNCVMSRFDAHMGVTNGQIIGCRLGHQCLNLIGHGDFLVEDTEAFGSSFITLRPDYGSTFDGNVTIRNCTWIPGSNVLSFFFAHNDETHDFGYPCRMPRTVTVENLTVKDGNIPEDVPFCLFPDFDPNFAPGKPFPLAPTERANVKNVRTEKPRQILPCQNPEEYPNLVFTMD